MAITAVARELGYATVDKFGRSFRAWTGVSPTDWRIQQGFPRLHVERVEQARQLLRTGQYRVGEAAKLVGFASSQALSMAFKSIYGCSPTTWLSQNLPAPEQAQQAGKLL